MSENVIDGSPSFQIDFRAFLQFIHSRLSGTTGGLVGAHNDFLEAKQFVQGPERHESNGRRAIGIGNELALFGFLAIDLGNYQGNLGFVPKGRLY
jgi:hypothetical protein